MLFSRRESSVKFYVHNVRGLKSEDKVEEIIQHMRAHNILVYCALETWRSGDLTSENKGFLIFEHGPPTQVGRGSGGVAFFLHPLARQAWIAAGSKPPSLFGLVDGCARVMALRLLFTDPRGRPLPVFLVAAYAPVSTCSLETKDEFLDVLTTCLSNRRSDEVLLLGADMNASLGVRRSHHDTVLGPHGVPHVNEAGRDLHQFLGTRALCSIASFFMKRHYATWFHPQSRRGHQIDHWIVHRGDLVRVKNAGRVGCIGVNSDHLPLLLELRIARSLRTQHAPLKRPRLNRALLCSVRHRSEFLTAFRSAASSRTSDSPLNFQDLNSSLLSAAQHTLSSSTRKRPDWFVARLEPIMSTVVARNDAQCLFNTTSTELNHHSLRLARRAVKREVKVAKTTWLALRVTSLNSGPGAYPRQYWDALKSIKSGMCNTKRSVNLKLRKPDGSLCETMEENATVFRVHFHKVYNINSSFDVSVLDGVRQRSTRDDLEVLPCVDEVIDAIKRARSNKASGDNGVPVEFYKVLMEDTEAFGLFMDCLEQFWVHGVDEAEWSVGRLKVIPKSGDLSDPNKWRGIMLLDVAGKVVCSIISRRLQSLLSDEGLEAQNGFTANRGCVDGSFSLRLALLKRKEHGLSTFALFVDLVKAFDSVPRDGLFLILHKFGVPPALCEIIRRMYTGFVVKLDVGGTDVEIPSTVGVKQGDNLSPVLFLFTVQAAMETLNDIWPAAKPVFNTFPPTKSTGRLRGRLKAQCSSARGTAFDFWVSLYADDGAFLLRTRAELIHATRLLFSHLKRFGLTMHVGRDGKKSKTEAMYFPPPGESPDATLTAPFEVDGGSIAFTSRFTYLGSIVTADLRDATDVDNRIASATSAFGALHRCVFSTKDISLDVKKAVYIAIVLSILLYGSESWCLTEMLASRLRRFHNKCVRIMCRVTRYQTWKHRIRTEVLLQRVGVRSMDYYLAARQLRWVGHVMRMDMSRLPRRFLTAWVQHPRPVGRPQLTFGHSLLKLLKKTGVPCGKNGELDTWGVLALDRASWRAMIAALRI